MLDDVEMEPAIRLSGVLFSFLRLLTITALQYGLVLLAISTRTACPRIFGSATPHARLFFSETGDHNLLLIHLDGI